MWTLVQRLHNITWWFVSQIPSVVAQHVLKRAGAFSSDERVYVNRAHDYSTALTSFSRFFQSAADRIRGTSHGTRHHAQGESRAPPCPRVRSSGTFAVI